jgi:phosphatidylglycerol---prolipoprotein diacylglyceryl transferase
MFPVLIDLFGFHVSSFGALLALGVVLGTWVGANLFEEQGLTRELAWTLAIWALIGGLLGAKGWFMAERWMRDPSQFDLSALLLGPGGLTWYGGFAGGFVAVTAALRVHGVSFWKMVNIAPIPALLAQAIGRVGCFMVGDDYGRASDVPWAVAFPKGAPPTLERVHPTMLYEAAWLTLCIFILWPRRRTSPSLFGEYLVLAGVGRFCNEFLRVNPPLVGPFSNAQVVSLLFVATGISLWLWGRQRATDANTPAPLAQPRRRRA